MALKVRQPEVGFGRDWFGSLARLEGVESRRVNQAMDQFVTNPDHPGLNLHPVKGDPSGRLHTIRASDDLRILLMKEGNVYVFFEAGHHDEIYERARRSRFVVNPHSGFIGLVDLPPTLAELDHGGTGAIAAPAETASAGGCDDSQQPAQSRDGGGILDHWGDADLAEAGLSPDEVARLRTCAVEDELLALDLDEETFGLVVDLLEVTPEEWRTPALDASATAEARVRDAIVRFGAVAGISPLFTPEEVRRIAAAPIEEWMIFLHPDQRALVDRRYEGPARIRGSAGTGKTVVALHRAAALARRLHEGGAERPILFTTYIKSLPPVFEALYGRLPGSGQGSAVEFVNIDKLAFKVCRQAGDRPNVSTRDVDAAYAAAHRSVVTPGSPLDSAGFTRGYLRDEVKAVIKGRGIGTLDEYLDIQRSGRRTPLTEPLRRQVWDLHQAWQREMAARGTVDFPDIVLRALEHARQRTEPSYAAAIVDEAQDLTLVGLQLVRALVNGGSGADRPDGLLIVGDGAQRIYPGGYTLGQAGVEVRGRTTVLRRNYRNTTQIIGAAMAVAGDEVVDDLGDEFARGAAPAETDRGGARPALVLCAGWDDELRFVADQVGRLSATGAIGPGDMAVATATNDQAKRVMSRLRSAGMAVQDLSRYDGVPTDQVKVGTHFRIKGLEFKVVFLPFLGAGDFPRPRANGQSTAEYDEERSRAVSQLYVAMTRARDGLFVLCSGEPSPTLEPAVDHFQLIET